MAGSHPKKPLSVLKSIAKMAKGTNTSSARLNELQINSSTYGRPIYLIFGQNKLTSNVIDYVDFTAISHKEKQSSGKGGTVNTSYTYSVAAVLALAEGNLGGVAKVIQDKSFPSLSDLGLGQYYNSAWSYMTSKHPDHALTYRGVFYLAGVLQLDSSGSIPNLEFIVNGLNQFGNGIVDVNPKDFVIPLLTDPSFGAFFPSAYLDDLSTYSNYCVANGLFISPVLTEQNECQQWIEDICQTTNSGAVWSQAKLKIIPYGDATITGNGATYTPDLTPKYDLTDDDFISAGDDPVKVTRKISSDAYNVVRVEFLNRANDYNTELAEARDQANIEMFGLRPMDTVSMHWVCDAKVAKQIAQLILQRTLYIRNSYAFPLGWKYGLLEPMDFVTLTDAKLDLNRKLVRIINIDEDENGKLSATAEEMLIGTASAPLYPSQQANRGSIDFNVVPGSVNVPVIFEPPDALGKGLNVWMGVSGKSQFWGGCNVWVSDNDISYKLAGTIKAGSRQGVLTSLLPTGTDPDTTNTLSIDLTKSNGLLNGGTQSDADSLNTLCYVDGELIAYENATLTDANQYNLTYLRRGAYGTTIKSHQIGTNFLRLDDTIFNYPFDVSRIGQTIYLKFTSINVFGGAEELLSDVQSYTYTITGSALTTPLPDVQNVVANYQNNKITLTWDKISDFRSVDYEIRMGTNFNSAQVLGRVVDASYIVVSNGTYWIVAHSNPISGLDVYSSDPTQITVSNAVLATNLFYSYDESGNGWTGSTSGGATLTNRGIQLLGDGDVLGCQDVLSVMDIFFYGGVASSGTYTSAQVIDTGNAQKVTLAVNYVLSIDTINSSCFDIQDVFKVASMYGNYSQYGNAMIQVAIAQDDGIFSDWQNFVPGDFFGRYFKFRVNLYSYNQDITTILDDFVFYCYMDDRIDAIETTLSASGSNITYTKPFHAVPKITSSIIGAAAGDDLVITNSTVNGFSAKVLNAGFGVNRLVDFHCKSY